jgi:hypothetical protein
LGDATVPDWLRPVWAEAVARSATAAAMADSVAATIVIACGTGGLVLVNIVVNSGLVGEDNDVGSKFLAPNE